MNCKTLLKNGNILTMNKDNRAANWIAIDDGIIVALGNGQFNGTATTEIDLNDKTVLPGFIDSHVHGSSTGLYLGSVVLKEAKSINDVMDLVEQRCMSTDDSIILGMDLTPENLYEKRMPYRWEIDKVSKDKKVFINHKTLHGSTCNSKAWDDIAVPKTMPGIEIVGGKYTGVLTDDISFEYAYVKLMDQIEKKVWVENCYKLAQHANAKGVTSIHSLNGATEPKDHRDILAILENSKKFTLNMTPYIEDFDISLAKKFGLHQAGGCLCLDGSRITYTAALFEPYNDKPESRGSLYFNDDKIYQFISDAHRNGMQIAMHAAGERAIDQLIYTIQRVMLEQGDQGLRHRIEHFSMPTEKHIKMASELGIVCAMQPAFPDLWDNPEDSLYERFFGINRAKRFEPFAQIIQSGVIVCGGSDSPVTGINPLAGIQACVNAKSELRRLSVEQALQLFTINGAYAAHEEKIRGSLETGKRADLVVLEEDPYFSTAIDRIKINMTFINGKIVYFDDF